MNKSVLLAGVCAAMILGAGAAQAQTTTNTFDNPVVLSPTQAPGAWYTDRFAPAGFATSGGVLHENLSGADFQGAGSFYNTQGRKLDLAAGVTSMSIDLFVSADYVGTDQRLAGFWGSAFDSSSTLSAFPIVELTDEGGSLNFVGWDNDTGTFFNIASADGDVGSWQTLTISLNTTTDLFTYSAGGASVTTAADGSTSIGNVILEGHNNGADLGISWDNLSTTVGGAVPEPATWAFMILGFGGVGAMLRRKAVRPVTA